MCCHIEQAEDVLPHRMGEDVLPHRMGRGCVLSEDESAKFSVAWKTASSLHHGEWDEDVCILRNRPVFSGMENFANSLRHGE